MHVKGYVEGRKPRVENLSTLSKTTMYKVWCTRGEEGMHAKYILTLNSTSVVFLTNGKLMGCL